jgi:hypothetical protein
MGNVSWSKFVEPDIRARRDYVRGRTAGARWAAENLFSDGAAAPFTAEFSDSPYNIGVVHGIAQELRQFADRLEPRGFRPAV